MKRKTCKRCCVSKLETAFYSHPRMADGRLSFCKECVRARARNHRAENLERIQEYDRNRPNADERRMQNRERTKKCMADPVARKRISDARKNWESKNNLKRRAHILVGNAIKYGRLKKQPCERCGTAERVAAHHEDYLKPMDVNWFCVPCHAKRHREINAERRKKQVAA